MRILFPLLLMLTLSVAACNRTQSDPAGGAPTSPTPAVSGPAKPAADPAASAEEARSTPVQILTWPQIQELIGQQRGKVVVLDVWSTYCGPCIRELPHLIELHRAHGAEVACLSLSVDYIGAADRPPDSYRAQVQKVLDRLEARLTNVLCATPDEEVFTQLGIASIPCVVVYDREGKVHKTFHNDQNEYGETGFSYAEHVLPVVQELQSQP